MKLHANFTRFLRISRFWNVERRKHVRSLFKAKNCKRILFHVSLVVCREPKFEILDAVSIMERESEVGFFGDARETLLIFLRIFVIGSVLTGILLGYLLTRLTNSHFFPEILLKGIEFLGPTFVKFGQWVSTRKDLFPEDLCNVLSKLQRNASVHSWIYTKHLLSATYGGDWRNLFVKFESESPIGSGCCAQVYKAWIDPSAQVETKCDPKVPRLVQALEYLSMGNLIDSLEKIFKIRNSEKSRKTENLQAVAVKVLHPGIKNRLRRDLRIMRGICNWATYIVPELHWLNLAECIDEFSRIMSNQVDMRLEARNLARFSQNFSGQNEVTFPKPFMDFTRREILVETFQDGTPISEFLKHEDTRFQKRLAKIGVATILKMIFKDNFIHCDLHPGNILVQRGSEFEEGFLLRILRAVTFGYVINGPRLIILDCGLVVSLNERCRQNLRDVFRSVLMGNGELAAEYILEHSSHTTPDPDGFKNTLAGIVRSYLGNRMNLKNVNVSTVVTELFSAMVRHRVKQDGSFSSVILSMAVIEGLGRSLDPNIDIFAEVLPFVFGDTLDASE